MAEITFPEDVETYKGQIRFTLVNQDGGLAGQQVNLFLPQGFQYMDKVEYENADLGSIGAAMAGGSGNSMNGTPSETLGSEDVRKSIMSSIASKLGGQTGGEIGRARTRTAPNPNTRALFKQVNLRSFSFQFKLIPTTELEAKRITDIVKLFRTELYPEEIPYTVPGSGEVLSIGYKFPNRFTIEQFYGDTLNKQAQKIKPAYLDSFTTNYNPTTQTSLTGRDGTYFSEVDIAMTFMESKTLSRRHIGEGF